MTDSLVPLSQLAAELNNVTASQLAKRLADEVLTDDLGRPCFDRPTAARLIGEYQARQAAQAAAERARNAAFRAGIGRQLDAIHSRTQAIQNDQAARRADGRIAPDATPLAIVYGPEKEAALDRKGRAFERLLKGESTYVRIRDYTTEE